MITCKCIQKFRDKAGRIYGYRLVDVNGQTQDVEPKNLKRAIENKQIQVVNLTLTSDNRLVDSNEKQLQSKLLGKAPVKTETSEEKFFDALEKVEEAFCKKIGAGKAGCGSEFLKNDSEGISWIDTILDVYYPDEYKGNPDDYEQCYGVSLNIAYDNNKKEFWMAFQGNNGMATEEFSMTVDLVKPLYSDRNIEIIAKAMNKFADNVKKWIYEDKNGLAHK